MSLLISGQNTHDLAGSWHFSTLWWAWCILSMISLLCDLGINTLFPLRIRPYSMDSSSRYAEYFLNRAGTYFCFSGHPKWMVSRRAKSSGSDEVSCLRVSSLASESCTKHTFCRLNDSSLGKGLSLDIGSAKSISVPGLYLIVMSYSFILSSTRWSLGGAAVRFFKWIVRVSRGLGTDFSVNFLQICRSEISRNQQQQQASNAQCLHNVSQCLWVPWMRMQ